MWVFGIVVMSFFPVTYPSVTVSLFEVILLFVDLFTI